MVIGSRTTNELSVMKKIFAVLGLAAVTMGSCTTDISEDVTNARGTTELTAALEGTGRIRKRLPGLLKRFGMT